MTYDLQTVKDNLSSNQAWVEQAIIRLYEFQTSDEKAAQMAKYHNGKGFNGTDAKRLSYYAKWLHSGKRLSGPHLQKAYKIVPKYAGQILSLINSK